MLSSQEGRAGRTFCPGPMRLLDEPPGLNEFIVYAAVNIQLCASRVPQTPHMLVEVTALVVHPGDTGGPESSAPEGVRIPYASLPARSSHSVLRCGDGAGGGGSSTCTICFTTLPSPAAQAQHRGGEMHRVRWTRLQLSRERASLWLLHSRGRNMPASNETRIRVSPACFRRNAYAKVILLYPVMQCCGRSCATYVLMQSALVLM